MKQLINKDTGELTLNNGFVVTKETKLNDLLKKFGKDKFRQSEYADDYYTLTQTKIDEYYVIFGFEFKDEKLKKISFQVETEPIKREAWTSQRDLETKWIAQQMNDKSNFIWNMKIAGRHYHLQYNWGCIGVYYDFKNGTFDSGLFYDK